LNIRARYSEKISVETLASASGMSRRFFEFQFHQSLECSSMN
jgi:transcriptional regulator GlxA family with amidase domain